MTKALSSSSQNNKPVFSTVPLNDKVIACPNHEYLENPSYIETPIVVNMKTKKTFLKEPQKSCKTNQFAIDCLDVYLKALEMDNNNNQRVTPDSNRENTNLIDDHPILNELSNFALLENEVKVKLFLLIFSYFFQKNSI